jgi:hypothetical protein
MIPLKFFRSLQSPYPSEFRLIQSFLNLVQKTLAKKIAGALCRQKSEFYLPISLLIAGGRIVGQKRPHRAVDILRKCPN